MAQQDSADWWLVYGKDGAATAQFVDLTAVRRTATGANVTVLAVDRAGNVGTATTSYRTLAYRVNGAKYRGGKFLLERGAAYRLVGTVAASGRVHGPARLGTVAKASTRLRNGAATVRIPRSAKVGSTWKIVVKTGSTSHTIKVKVTR